MRRLLACAASLLAGASSLAEPTPTWLTLPPDSAPTPPAEHASLAPDPAQREAWLAQGESYVELLWRSQIRVAASGAVESRAELVRHFLTEPGIQQAGNLELSADASRDRLRIEAAYAVTPGSAPRAVAAETIQVVDDAQADIFSDWRRVIVPYAGLVPGSNAVLTATRSFRADEWPLPWSRLIFLAGAAPVARQEISIVREPGAPPITWATDDPELRCEERADRELFCRREAMPAISQDPDVASYADLVPHLFVGVEETWEGLRRTLGELVRENAHADAALRQQVDSLLAGADTPMERFRRIHRFVADEVRYVALSHGTWAVVPRPAPATFERRFGDCKDKVTLLVAMADLAGLRVIPVLTSSGRYQPVRLLRAGSSYFDHMIACAELPDGLPVCVDPTVAHAGALLPAQLAGAVALELREDGPARVTQLPRGDFGWDVVSHRSIALGCDGVVGERSERAFSGPAALNMRSQLLAWRTDDRQRWASEEYRLAVASDLRPDFAFDGLAEPDAPLRVRYQTDTPGRHDPDGSLYLDVDPWLVSYMRGVVSQNRHHPHRMVGLRYVAEDTYEPCGAPIDLAGPVLRFEARFGKVLRQVQRRGGSVTASTTVEIPATTIPAAELAEFNRFVENALQQSSLWLAWEPREPR